MKIEQIHEAMRQWFQMGNLGETGTDDKGVPPEKERLVGEDENGNLYFFYWCVLDSDRTVAICIGTDLNPVPTPKRWRLEREGDAELLNESPEGRGPYSYRINGGFDDDEPFDNDYDELEPEPEPNPFK